MCDPKKPRAEASDLNAAGNVIAATLPHDHGHAVLAVPVLGQAAVAGFTAPSREGIKHRRMDGRRAGG